MRGRTSAPWADSIQGRIGARIAAQPGDGALAFVAGDGHLDRWTWKALDAEARRRAALLRDAGLGRGDVCVLVLPSDADCALTLLGVLVLGAVPLLIAPPTIQGSKGHLAEIVARVTRKTEARLVIEEPLRGDPAQEVEAWHEPASDAVAALQLTSGTTGFPRVCVWSQRGVLAALEAMQQAMRLGARDRCVNWTPLYHDMGLVNNFLLCLCCGVPLAQMTPQDFIKRPALWLRTLSDTGATVTWSPNFGFAICVASIRDADLEGVRLHGVRAFYNAAERIHHPTIRRFRERFAPFGVGPHAVRTNFGCAENVGGATFSDPDGPYVVERVDADRLEHDRLAVLAPGGATARQGRTVEIVGVGRPAPGLEVEILERSGEPLPQGSVGEIAIRTPSRMLRYLGDGQATHEAIRGDLLLTGDLGYVRHGEVFWIGRVRERIVLSGRKFDPSDFEQALLSVDELRPGCFVAFGVDDPARGTQKLVIAAEVRDPVGFVGIEANANESAAELEALRQRVHAAVVREVGVRIDELLLVPRGSLTKTSSGKRRHRHCKGLYLRGEFPAPFPR